MRKARFTFTVEIPGNGRPPIMYQTGGDTREEANRKMAKWQKENGYFERKPVK